ncbi:MAG: hypothetical protein IAF58_16910 [Leptolyngbya sp.]|nr:hypothetical protein [Candidatus Melainabacteria bacterium]
MDNTLVSHPATVLPRRENVTDPWLDQIDVARLLELCQSTLFAVKDPHSPFRLKLKIAKSLPGESAKAKLVEMLRAYLSRQRALEPLLNAEIERSAAQGIPTLTEDGTLPPGFWHSSVEEFLARFAFNRRRKRQANRLLEALALLKEAGVASVTIGGSFVSGKPQPSDIDLVWDTDGLDHSKLHPAFTNVWATERQKRFGLDAHSAADVWKLKLLLVQSLWSASSPEAEECGDDYDKLPRFRAVGVVVVAL